MVVKHESDMIDSLKYAIRARQMLINPDVKVLIAEFRKFKFPKPKDPILPKLYDHELDQLFYDTRTGRYK